MFYPIKLYNLFLFKRCYINLFNIYETLVKLLLRMALPSTLAKPLHRFTLAVYYWHSTYTLQLHFYIKSIDWVINLFNITHCLAQQKNKYAVTEPGELGGAVAPQHTGKFFSYLYKYFNSQQNNVSIHQFLSQYCDSSLWILTIYTKILKKLLKHILMCVFITLQVPSYLPRFPS
jgi:hypothetical protein